MEVKKSNHFVFDVEILVSFAWHSTNK